MRPPPMTARLLAWGKSSVWCVARTTVAPRASIMSWMQWRKMCWHVCMSTADRGESSTLTSAWLYAARASAMRCFWPPDRLPPRSPM
mmetsp:Transcript_60837/g.127503  ORF Transcript_60837/g.127503 Transcript_60837/m.127503 type:complete len:87 (+) Transcript_60837:39-299(+)